MSKYASITHFFVESFKIFKSARLPSTNERAPRMIDLPAPVSPVIDVIPLLKLTSILSIIAKFDIERVLINRKNYNKVTNNKYIKI